MRSLLDASIRIAGTDIRDCLWLHPGAERACEPTDSGEAYTETAFIPVRDRRRLSTEELNSIASLWHWPSSSCVSILRLDDDAINEMRSLKDSALGHPASEEFMAHGSKLWELLCAKSDISSLGPAQWLGISRRPSGLRTSTFDGSCGLRIGLHLDSWDQAGLHQRHMCRTRLCINLGLRTRGLFFLPFDIRSITEALGADPQVHSANIGERFCEGFPGSPVLELEVPPGYAYLAPTENLIHDGRSEPSPEHDITAAWLGFITYSASFER